jgi:S1-C subfamily serine protease
MRKLVALGMALALSLGASAACLSEDVLAVEQQMTGVVDQVGKSIVSVSALSPLPSRVSGSAGAVRPMARSVGCGVVFDRDGLILTTASVVGYAPYVDIATVSGEKYRGTVVGTDPVADIAVVRVEASGLVPAKFADAPAARPGALVLVLGNAFGALPSVSMGVVSNVAGSAAQEDEQAMLRLAVPINPGDIGGPVVNTAGEVVGIVVGRLTFQQQAFPVQVGDRTVVGLSGGPQASNMSVAVPADRATAVAEEILKNGGTRKGFLGVRVMNLSEDLRGDLGDETLKGVMVTSVVPGSPAESVGIAAGDVITSFGSNPVESITALGEAVGGTTPGDLVDVRYVRGGERFLKTVRIDWFVPEFMREAAFSDYAPDPEQMRSRIEDLKAETQLLEQQLHELEKKK